jgi:hypothetical protein
MTDDLKCYIGRIGLILYLLHPPASGVVAHEQFGGGGEVIGDEEGGLFAPVAPDNNLPQLPLVGESLVRILRRLNSAGPLACRLSGLLATDCMKFVRS